jgi:transcriptional/translational regulatory protein YebC/TACO1
VAEVRHAFSKCGGSLGTSGSVGFLFTETGVLSYPAGCDEERIMEIALEAAADDVVTNEDDSIEVLTKPAEFEAVKRAMLEAGLEPEAAEVTMRANNNSSLDIDNARKMVKLLEMLEDLDDTQNVYSNADIAENILAQI